MEAVALSAMFWMGQVLSKVLLIHPIRTRVATWAHQNVIRHCTVSEPQFSVWGGRSIQVSIKLKNHSFAKVLVQGIEGIVGQDSREVPIGSFSGAAISCLPETRVLERQPPNNSLIIRANITPDILFWAKEFPPSLIVVDGAVLVTGTFGQLKLPIGCGLQAIEKAPYGTARRGVLDMLKISVD